MSETLKAQPAEEYDEEMGAVLWVADPGKGWDACLGHPATDSNPESWDWRGEQDSGGPWNFFVELPEIVYPGK